MPGGCGAGGCQWRPALDDEPGRGVGRARTRSSWTARRPAAGRRGYGRRSRPASTSISKSRPRPRSTRRWSWRALAHAAGVKHGVIQDKLFLPGFAKLLFVKNAGFFGRILSITIDAGSWIFDGTSRNASGRAGTTRRAEGGGLALDMMAHWRYMIDRLAAPVTAVCALMATAIPSAWTSMGGPTPSMSRTRRTRCCSSQGGAVGVITNSWATRVRRDDTMVVQIDGTLRLGGGRPPALLHPKRGEHAGGLLRRSRPGGMDFSRNGRRSPTRCRRQVPSGSAGRLPAPRRRGCALCADAGRGREGGAARRSSRIAASTRAGWRCPRCACRRRPFSGSRTAAVSPSGCR